MHDRTSGNFFHKNTQHHIELTAPHAVWTDIIDCPNAECITVRNAAAQSHHISLRGMPKLQRILNPAGAPLVLHLDLHKSTQLITIEGPINHIDVAWQGGDYIHSSKQDFNGAVVLPSNQLEQLSLSQLDADSLLLVYQAHSETTHQQYTLSHKGTTVLHSIQGLSHVNLRENQAVHIHQCKQLKHIQGNTFLITLHNCGENQLLFSGYQQHIKLIDCGVHRLQIEAAKLLTVRGQSYLERADIPTSTRLIESELVNGDVFPRINEGTLERLLEAYQTAPIEEKNKAIENLLGTVANAKHSKAQLYGIRLLATLAKQKSVYHKAIWETRQRMVPEHKTWCFPADLELEGWRSDVQLWCALVHNNGNTKINQYYQERLLSLAHKPRVYYALVTVLLQEQQYERLQGVLKRVDSVVHRSRHLQLSSDVVKKAMRRLIVSIKKQPETLQQAVIAHLFTHCSRVDLVDVGRRLLNERPSMTRQLALRMTKKRPDCRTTLMALALGAAPNQEPEQASKSNTLHQLFTYDPRSEFLGEEQESNYVD